MKKKFAIFIIIVILSLAKPYLNLLEKVRKELVEKALLSLPQINDVDILKMFIEISNTKEEYSLKDEESIFLIYKWITDNIWYDCSGNGGVETPASIYKSRTGTSKGISN